MYDLYVNVIKRPSIDVDELYSLRQKLSSDGRTIRVTDMGAGSSHMPNRDRKISDIFRYTTTPHKFSSLYSRIIDYYKLRTVIELGTSVGVNTIYLAKVSRDVNITTFEGSDAIAQVARDLFRDNELKNIRLIEGNIDETLAPYLDTIDQLDFALIDANHRFEPTMRYLELLTKRTHSHSVIAVDDIHSSSEMERAWRSIENHPRVQATVDLYRCGLIFFNPSLTRQNVVLQF
jgi:predicted O-methyltransferase YrrM